VRRTSSSNRERCWPGIGGAFDSSGAGNLDVVSVGRLLDKTPRVDSDDVERQSCGARREFTGNSLAADFFGVPTVTYRLLFVLVILSLEADGGHLTKKRPQTQKCPKEDCGIRRVRSNAG
jgi:hypothetical protein